MKLGDIDISALIIAIDTEKAKWMMRPDRDSKPLTDVENATIGMLYALSNALREVPSIQEKLREIEKEHGRFSD
jgi:hypothetical protein